MTGSQSGHISQRIPLGGADWRFKGFWDEGWAREDTLARLHPEWPTATVPSSVPHDLWQCGLVPDPYREMNTLALEWVAQRSWIYQKAFRLERGCEGRARLAFEGLDYQAQVFLNGERLGAHRSQFTPAHFELGDRLRSGDNLLAVVLSPAPQGQSQFGRTSLVREHKARMSYGWDFCPRLPHLGIWDEVYLELSGAARFEDVWVRPQLAEELKRANVTVALELSALEAVDTKLEAVLRYQGAVVASECMEFRLEPGVTQQTLQFTLECPKLWWPNGYGEAALYEFEMRLTGADKRSDRRIVSFGVRRLEFADNDTPDAGARPYTLVVNGHKVYLKGWNWVPLDLMYGVERPEKLERLLTLAKRANVNLLRVNGVGLIEKEAFYALCDRLGLMVWQEFSQSSSAADRKPAKDAAFLEMMAQEAEAIIPRKRNHPSLAIWGGGNELESLDFLPLDDAEPVLRVLRETVERLDPGRLWLPTSASGPMPYCGINTATRSPFIMHDVHGPWYHQGLREHYALFNRSRALLHSEFGAEGLTNLRTLEATIAQRDRWPANPEKPVWSHLGGAWWLKNEHWAGIFGEIKELKTLVQASQYLQAEGVRYAVEANRRRKFENSGSLPWMFNEPYPMAACTSAVDYYARPKPLYYAVARAYAPVTVTAKLESQVWAGKETFAAEIWANNTCFEALEQAKLTIRCLAASGYVYVQHNLTVTVGANSAVQLTDFSAPLSSAEELFFLDLALGTLEGEWLATNRYLLSRTHDLSGLFQLGSAELEVERCEGGLTIRNAGEQSALFVWLADTLPLEAKGSLYLSDNHFCLLPGESKTVAVNWPGVLEAERQLKVSGWNTNTLTVEGS